MHLIGTTYLAGVVEVGCDDHGFDLVANGHFNKGYLIPYNRINNNLKYILLLIFLTVTGVIYRSASFIEWIKIGSIVDFNVAELFGLFKSLWS